MTVIFSRLRVLLICAAALLIPLIFWPWSRDSYRVVKEAGLGVYMIPALAIWLAAGRPGFGRIPRWYLGIGAAFMAWILFRSIGTADASSAAIRVMEWLLVFCAACAVLGLDDSDRCRVLYSLVAGATIAAFWGILQYIFGGTFLVPYQVDPRSVTFTSDRIFSTFGNPVFFAAYLILVFPLTVVFAAGNGSRMRGCRYLLAGAAALQLVALAFAASRGAFIGLGAAMIFLFLKSRETGRTKLKAAAAGLVLLAAIGIMQPALVRHLLTTRDPGRIVMWRTALKMWERAPLLGAGLAQFPREYPCAVRELGVPKAAEVATDAWHAHNEYLQAAAELGIPGAVLLVLLVFGLLALPVTGFAGPAIQAGVMAVAVNALFNFPFNIPPLQVFIWLMPALVLAGTDIRSADPRDLRLDWLILGLLTVIAIRPLLRSSYVQWGLAYQDAERRSRADICFERAQMLLPGDARERISYYRGKNAFEAGDIVYAQRYFEEDKEDFPCHVEGYGNLAVIYGIQAQRGDSAALATALSFIDEAISLRPVGQGAAGNYNTLGNLRVLAGDEAGAIKAYRKALDCNPRFIESASNLIQLLLRRGQRSEALRIYEEVSKLSQGDAGLEALAAALQKSP